MDINNFTAEDVLIGKTTATLTPEYKKEIQNLFLSGKTPKEIAQQYETATNVINAIVKHLRPQKNSATGRPPIEYQNR